MASFDAQIANYAGTIGSEDTQTALENGVKDVVNRMMKISPDSMFMFSGIVKNTSGNSYVAVADTDKILGVTRLKETTNVARNCVEVPATLRGEVGDSTSLHAATKEYPVYYKLNGNIYVVPDYTTEDKIEVNKVVYGAVTNKDANNAAIANFPTGMIPLVIMYASAKVLLEKMAEYTDLPATLDISSLISGAVAIPGDPSFKIDEAILESNSGNLYGTAYDLPPISDLPSIASVTNLIGSDGLDIDLEMGAVDTDSDEIEPKKWFGVLSEFIESEEDIELARAQVEKIAAYVSWYQQALAENLQKFNADWQKWESRLNNGLQIMFKEAEVQEYASKLQKYQASWQQVVSQVNAEVQSFGANLQRATTDYKWMADRYLFLMSEYEKAFQPYADKGEQAT